MRWKLRHKLFGWHYVEVFTTTNEFFVRRVHIQPDGKTLKVGKIRGSHCYVDMGGALHAPCWVKSLKSLTMSYQSYGDAVLATDRLEELEDVFS